MKPSQKAATVLVLFGLLLHTYAGFGEASSFSVGFWLWSLSPYIVGAVLLTKQWNRRGDTRAPLFGFIPPRGSSLALGARMHQSELVSQLLKPMSYLDTSRASPKEVVLAALTWPAEGWAAQALDWLDAGVPLDNDLVAALEQFASVEHNSQVNRHKAFAFVKRWHRANQST